MTPEQAARARGAALGIANNSRLIVRELDVAHAQGVHVPLAAREALATLGALVDAWLLNSAGQPVGDDIRRRLGYGLTSCDGVREHYNRETGALECACGGWHPGHPEPTTTGDTDDGNRDG